MSGIANAASTIPGSVATFCSCSSDLSAAIASSSSWSANTRAGTRIAPAAGISQSVSSTCRSSDIEHHLRVPPVAGRLELETMVGDRLHQWPRRAEVSPDSSFEAVAQRDLRVLRDEAFRLGQEQELLEPLDEQGAAIRR